MINSMFLLCFSFVLAFPTVGWCQKNSVIEIKKPVEQSLEIRKKNQKNKDKWDHEKSKLLLSHEQLDLEYQALVSEHKDLEMQLNSQKILNQGLLKQKIESLRVQRELLPFLEVVFSQMENLVKNDPPFLTEERSARIRTLAKVMEDPEVTISEKYRKVMETLFIEAEYGSTIEVYQEKIRINEEEVLGNIFRLGRVSLLFLALDKGSAAYYNVAENSWEPLPENDLIAIRSAVEIGTKRKPVELLSLPLGRLATGEESP